MSAASPPAITASVPSSAPLVPPETGASIHPIPFLAFSRAAISRAASGWIDEKSTTSFPAPATVARPLAPNTTSSTAAASVRHMKMMPAVLATSHGCGARFDQCGGLGCGPVPHRDAVTGVDETPGHQKSHHPEPEIAELFGLRSIHPANARHRMSPWLCAVLPHIPAVAAMRRVYAVSTACLII